MRKKSEKNAEKAEHCGNGGEIAIINLPPMYILMVCKKKRYSFARPVWDTNNAGMYQEVQSVSAATIHQARIRIRAHGMVFR